MSVLTFGSLFAGIGGFDLGFERAGMRCKWQVEIDPYARKVLDKHWPEVPKWDDVRTFPPEGDWSVDVICGGFPCQDISVAGKGAGIDGERSGLWSEYVRIIRLLRPRFVVVENVSALTFRGLDRVLGDLAESGFDAEWACIPASAFGSLQTRDRLWIVANANGHGGAGLVERLNSRSDGQGRAGREADLQQIYGFPANAGGCWPQPIIRGVDGRIPARVDRIRCLGNAVVPQVTEFIGRLILDAVSPQPIES